MYNKVRNKVSRILTNLSGWCTNRQIVVFESDDWGSIRMPSKKVYNECLAEGYPVDQIAYERYDSLASEDDLELLFDLLQRYEDKRGNHPVITANVLVANPDFEKIKASNYRDYHFELITETFKRYPNHSNCFNLWHEGKEHGLFFPQSHGREHLNVSLFMEELRQNKNDVHFGFKHGMPGSIPKGNKKRGNKYVSALTYRDQNDKNEKLSIIIEGLDLFEFLFGYRSKSFIPPNYKWSPDFNREMYEKGVRYYQGNRKMIEPVCNGSPRVLKYKLGELNNYNQLYLVRNALFEPTLMGKRKGKCIDRCLGEIDTAFKLKKPAVICSHRLNYVGYIDEKNRDENLKLLDQLLRRIQEKWPEVEFMNSVQLGELIECN